MLLGIFGSVFVARSLVVKAPEATFADLWEHTGWDYPYSAGGARLLHSWLRQNLEAKWGAGLLSFGFLFQAGGHVLSGRTAYRRRMWGLLVLLFVAAPLLWILISRWTCSRAADQGISFYSRLRARAGPEYSGADWAKTIDERVLQLRQTCSEE